MHQALQLREKCEHPPIALRRGDHRVLLEIAYDRLLSDTRSAAALSRSDGGKSEESTGAVRWRKGGGLSIRASTDGSVSVADSQ